MSKEQEVENLIPKGRTHIKPKIGRPQKISMELIERIADHIRKGNFIDVSCAFEGIHKDTYYRWLKEGANSTDPDDLKKIFSDTVSKAEAESIIDMNDDMAKHGANNWKPIAWRMERRFQNKYGKRQEIEVKGNPLEGLNNVIEESKKLLKKEDLDGEG